MVGAKLHWLELGALGDAAADLGRRAAEPSGVDEVLRLKCCERKVSRKSGHKYYRRWIQAEAAARCSRRAWPHVCPVQRSYPHFTAAHNKNLRLYTHNTYCFKSVFSVLFESHLSIVLPQIFKHLNPILRTTEQINKPTLMQTAFEHTGAVQTQRVLVWKSVHNIERLPSEVGETCNLLTASCLLRHFLRSLAFFRDQHDFDMKLMVWKKTQKGTLNYSHIVFPSLAHRLSCVIIIKHCLYPVKDFSKTVKPPSINKSGICRYYTETNLLVFG